VHFVIHAESEAKQPYVVQDDDRHFVRTLSLPPHATFEVEIGYVALLPFKLLELVIGCDGSTNPGPTWKRYRIGTPALPARMESKLSTRASTFTGSASVAQRRTHYVVTAKLNTRAPGTYLLLVSFITGEIEGNAALSIVVERSREQGRSACGTGTAT